MSTVVIPEFAIHKTLEALLKFVRTDYAAQVDKTKSYLYKLFNTVGLQRYNLFDQGVAVICNPDDSPRKLKVDIMFNQYHDKVPTISITLPAEASAAQNNGLGQDEGYEEGLYDEGDKDNDVPGTYTPVYTRSYQAVYDLIITSDNSNEVILLYHFLKALITAAVFHFHQNGIYNINISGQDVNIKETTRDRYTRAVRVNLQYETSVPAIHSHAMPHSLGDVDGIPVLEL